MTRTVQLSEEAYARLTAEKEEGESYSDAVLRLVTEKDPMRWVGRRKIPKEYDETLRKMREAEVERVRELWE
jgi:predicted CopG family antitoxin